PGPAARRVAFLRHDAIVGVEVTKVVRRHVAESGQHPRGYLHLAGQVVEVGGEQFGQAVDAVEVGGAFPGQVVEADVVEGDRGGFDAEQAGEAALKTDGHVAQAHGAVAGVEQGPGDDAGRVGEVDDPGAGGGPLGGALGHVEDDGDGPQGLGQAAGAGG